MREGRTAGRTAALAGRRATVVLAVAVLAVVGTAGCTSTATPGPLDTGVIRARVADPASSAASRPGGSSVTTAGDSAGTASPPPVVPGTDGFDRRAGLSVPPFVDEGAEIDIDDQSGSGTTVHIDEARVTRRDSLLAVFSADGVLLGSAPVTPTAQPVTVVLRRPATSGTLVAVLFTDDGDNQLHLGVDAPIVDDDGELARSDFDYQVA